MIRNISTTSQISKTLPSHDVIKTITINFYGISDKPTPILLYEYC